MLSTETILADRFQLRESLNSNPVRQTWLGRDLKRRDRVVIKLLAMGNGMQWDDVKLLEREAQVLQRLDHPRLVRYRDYFSVDDQNLWFGLVTEYLPGVSLKQKLESGYTFSRPEVMWIATEVLEILSYLHQFAPPILHRDIKPSNLIWGEDNRIYLIDFGSVQIQFPTPGATFTVVGTLGYTPIEQFGGQSTTASDFYALGMTLVHLLTGCPPADFPQESFRVKFRDRIPQKTDIRLITWLERLTEPLPENRFYSADEALLELQKLNFRAVIAPATESNINLSQTDDKLTIQIPCRFSLQFIRPMRHTAKWLVATTKEKLSNLNILVKSGVFVSIIITLIILQKLPIPTGKIALFLLEVIAAIPLIGLILAIPGSLIFLMAILTSGEKYFERISLNFDNENYEICWHSSAFTRRQQGKLSYIQEINPLCLQDSQGNFHHSLEIVTQEPLLFLFSRRRTYRLGDQLEEAEVKHIQQEIRHWIGSKNQG
ncbi:MAG: serine/threonine protein kinase [Arthrospira sp. PLM2.Bin9]|nr:serine/threonine-protein kinase [Arthrospira sp. PLM2.Bin9]TVU55017.1 MAG: serine/threonine protein kinase [Arthrospira sp. PLM2.Bin9]